MVVPFLSLADDFVVLAVVLPLPLDLLSDLVLFAPFFPFSSFLPLALFAVDLVSLADFLPVDLVSFFPFSLEAVSFFLDSGAFLAYFFSSAFF